MSELFKIFLVILRAIIFPDTMEITFEKVTSAESITLEIKGLYDTSFPIEERRNFKDIENRINNSDPIFSFYVLKHIGKIVGFITLWRLPRSLYCEHFAILPQDRCKGYGEATIHKAIDMASQAIHNMDLPLVLEVELPEKSPEAARRVDFYRRCGMIALEEFPYWQPPYRRDLLDVPMMLMASQPIEDPTALAMLIHTIVYNQ